MGESVVRVHSWLFFYPDAMRKTIFLAACMAAFTAISGCSYKAAQDGETISVVDQLGRTATVRRHMTRISALHHFGGRIVFALGQQDKLVEQSLYGREAKALAAVDAKFAAMPKTQAQDGHAINLESLIAFGP